MQGGWERQEHGAKLLRARKSQESGWRRRGLFGKERKLEKMVKVEASGKNLLVRKLPLARMAKETLRSPFEILLGFASPLPANDLKLLIAVTA